jgi:RteC protein
MKMIGMTGFEALYLRLESTLEELDSAMGAEGREREVGLVLAAIGELRAGLPAVLADRESEIAFFYAIWPRFYGKLFYYSLVDRFELDRAINSAEALPVLVQREERRAICFFRKYREFWGHFKRGSSLIAEQFTRAYSRSCQLDPLSQVLDPEGATVASHRAAWGLAFEEYRLYLARVANEGTAVAGSQFEWKETKSAAVELLKAQAEKQSIYINGRPATAAQLKADFEARYRLDLKDFDKLLYAGDTRKKEATPYLNELVAAFEERRGRLRK